MPLEDGMLPIKGSNRHRLHPALDIIGDVFYFGISMPVELAESSVDDRLCFITSKHEGFIANETSLGQRDLELNVPSVVMPLLWDNEDIRTYAEQHVCDNFMTLPTLIRAELDKYFDLVDEKTAILVSLWIIGTYLQPIWDTYPYLSITGTKRAGKSKLLWFISLLGFNSIFSTSTSSAMIYRLIESLRCTFLLDESEKYASSDKQEDIRSILNSGYKKYGRVLRTGKTEKGQIIPERFEAFSPKAFVSYRGLEGVTEDRCIPIVMLRSRKKSVVNAEPIHDDTVWQRLRNCCYRFALDNFAAVKNIYRTQEIEVPHEDYMSRERELWKPILTLASYFGLVDKIVPYVISTIKKRKALEESSPIYVLLESLVLLVDENGNYSNSQILAKLAERFRGCQLPQYATSEWVGNTLMRQFNVDRGARKGSSVGYHLSPDIVRNLCVRNGVDYDAVKASSSSKAEEIIEEQKHFA